MAWPSAVTALQSALASDYNSLLTVVQIWGGDVSAAGNSALDLLGVGLHTANASWQEFRWRAVAGASAASDVLGLQVNARASSGDADAWSNVLTVASLTGGVSVASAVAFNGALTLGAGLNLAGQTISGAAAFSGALTFTGTVTATNTTQIFGAGQAVTSGFSTSSGLGGSLLLVDTGGAGLNGGAIVFGAAAGNWRFAALKGAATNGGANSQGAISVLVRLNAADATLTESVRFRDDGGISFNYPQNLSFGGGWQNWSPSVTGSGSLNITLNGGSTQYLRIGPLVYWYIAYAVTVNSGTGNSIGFSVPVTNNSDNAVGLNGVVNSPSASIASAGGYVNGQTIQLFLTNAPNLPTGPYTFFVSGFYRAG